MECPLRMHSLVYILHLHSIICNITLFWSYYKGLYGSNFSQIVRVLWNSTQISDPCIEKSDFTQSWSFQCSLIQELVSISEKAPGRDLQWPLLAGQTQGDLDSVIGNSQRDLYELSSNCGCMSTADLSPATWSTHLCGHADGTVCD